MDLTTGKLEAPILCGVFHRPFVHNYVSEPHDVLRIPANSTMNFCSLLIVSSPILTRKDGPKGKEDIAEKWSKRCSNANHAEVIVGASNEKHRAGHYRPRSIPSPHDTDDFRFLDAARLAYKKRSIQNEAQFQLHPPIPIPTSLCAVKSFSTANHVSVPNHQDPGGHI